MNCFICRRVVASKEKIVCVRKTCKNSFHCTCVGLTELEAKKQHSSWFCDSCKSEFCLGCNEPVEGKDRINCTTCSCIYHSLCVGPMISGSDWTCPKCKIGEPKQDKSNTPLKAPTADSSLNVTVRKSQPTTDEDLRAFIELGNHSLKADILSLSATIATSTETLRAEMEAKFARIEAGVARISDLENELAEAKKRISELESLQLVQAKAALQQLDLVVNNQQQYNLRNELEIVGIPESDNENLEHTVMLISKKVGVDLNMNDVDEVTRVGPKRPKVLKHQVDADSLPRLIVLKLVRRAKRNELINAVKARSNLTSEGVVAGPARQIYFNERLTKEKRLLLRETKLRSRQHSFRYCWVRGGVIFVRRAEKHPAIQIHNTGDLDSTVGPPLALEAPQLKFTN